MPDDTPEPLIKGRFSLFETPEGGYHIAYIPDGMPETMHLEIPGMIVRMAKAGAEGKLSPLRMMQGMMNRG